VKLRRILLPTDLSGTAERALRQAVELAALHKARLEVFHVITIEREDPARLEEALERYLKKVEDEVFADLSSRTDAVRTRGIAVDVGTARSRAPHQAILARIEESGADMVVMGTHGRSGVQRMFLGSVAERVIRGARCPVMTVGEDAGIAEGVSGFHPILVPVDFTEYSRRAIEVAKGLLAAGGKLVLEHVVSSPVHPEFYAGSGMRLFQADPGLPRRIGEELASLFDGPKDVVVTEGNVVEDILLTAASRKVQTIVMGTRGLGGLDHVLLGSVTERIVRRAAVPVVAVK
jgi:nucleotide-binding universal stress UspA family protein